MLCGAPSFTFLAVCLLLYIPIFYTLTFYAPIFCSFLFSFVYLAPRLSFTFFFFSQFWRPYLLILYFTILIISPPFRSVLFCFPFVLCGAPSFTFVAVCLRLYIPIFASLAPLSFLLQFLSFKSLSICHLFLFFFPFPSILCPLFSFSSPFPFSFHFLSPFPFPFLLFTPSSLSSSFLLPLFDAPFGHFLAPPCGHPGCKRTLCTPQDMPLPTLLPLPLHNNVGLPTFLDSWPLFLCMFHAFFKWS